MDGTQKNIWTYLIFLINKSKIISKYFIEFYS